MTVPAEIVPIDQIADGSNVTFPYTFYVRDKTWLKVSVDDVVKALDTDYTVTGEGDPDGGNVVFVVAETPAVGAAVRIELDLPLTQLISFALGTPLSEETLGLAFDKLTLISQQMKRLITAAIGEDGGLSETYFIGNWINAARYASINAAVAAQGTNTVTLVVTSPMILTASLTVPSTISLLIINGGSIAKASTYTLTINGPLAAGPYEIFIGFSAGNVSFATLAAIRAVPQWWGALADSATDDTTAIQCALSAANEIYFPPGTYMVDNPNAVTAAIFTLKSNIEIHGKYPSSVIKIKDTPTAYYSLFHKVAPVTDGVNIHDMVIDQNSDNDTYGTTASPRITAYLDGKGLRWHHNWVKNQDGRQSVDFNGTSVEDVEITDNLWTNIGVASTPTDHDCSVIYTALKDGAAAAIRGNYLFAGTDGHLYGARTAIEVHGSNHTIAENHIKGFRFGMNVTGIATYDSVNNLVQNNNIDVVQIAVQVWTEAYGAHTTGYGINGLIISDNFCRIRQTTYDYTALAQANRGICLILSTTGGAADLGLANVDVHGNTLLFDDQDITGYTDAASIYGIGFILQTTDIPIDNLRVSKNKIINCPGAAIRFQGGNFSNLVIKDNEIVDPGQSLDAVNLLIAYKIPIFLAPRSWVTSPVIEGNTIRDNFDTTRIQSAFYFLSTQDSSAVPVILKDNEVVLAGATTTAFTRCYDHTTSNNTTLSISNDRVTKLGTIPNKNVLIGSRLYDIGADRWYHVKATGTTWNSVVHAAAAPTTGTWKVGDIAWNTAPAAGGAPGWVCTTAGTPGTWSAMASLGLGEPWPIGSVFLSVVATNPATLLGYGTWAQIAAGKMLVGLDGTDTDFDTVEETGGAKTHTHAGHSAHVVTQPTAHTVTATIRGAGAGDVVTTGDHSGTAVDAHSAHDTPSSMNPYFVVYIWKRTA